jgi:hypothetical protein
MEYNIEEQIVLKTIEQMRTKLEELVVEGLRLKGFDFERREELLSFIKINCRLEQTQQGESIYYINDIPFLLYIYKMELPEVELDVNNQLVIKADYGSYSFL